jgi:glycosyltransferase involved in cell wall biosynthesis
MLSFVIPAHNEEACIARTVQAIQESARAVGESFEVIVANDASTDRTAEIARALGAAVLDVNHRQIARTRNSGARTAQGEFIFFVDADTTINPRALGSALRHLRNGAVGGGGPVKLEGPLPLFGHLLSALIGIWSNILGFVGGAFMFCTRAAFHATGGFDERMFFAEEGAMALALKREGRFVVLWERVLSSGRRFRRMTGLQVLKIAFRMLLSARKTITTRNAVVESVWYDSNRQEDDQLRPGLGARLSNAILLFIVLLLLAGPILRFVPWSATPLDTVIGKARFLARAIQAHIGFLLLPAAAWILLRNLVSQQLGRQWIMSALLAAFCAWQAFVCARVVGWVWAQISTWPR